LKKLVSIAIQGQKIGTGEKNRTYESMAKTTLATGGGKDHKIDVSWKSDSPPSDRPREKRSEVANFGNGKKKGYNRNNKGGRGKKGAQKVPKRARTRTGEYLA